MGFALKAIMILGSPWEVYKQDHTDEFGVSVWAVIDWDWNQSHTPNCLLFLCCPL